jgi:hypothetical protein
MNNAIRIFISHSSEDVAFAAAIVELLRAALNVPAMAIRCTSVEGYQLPGGADVDSQLRREVSEAEAFVGILSSGSLRSTYVLFELGARWGIERHLLPVLAPATPAAALTGPLARLNALRGENAEHLYKLVEEVGAAIGVTPESTAVYRRYIEALAESAMGVALPRDQRPIPSTITHGTNQGSDDVRSLDALRRRVIGLGLTEHDADNTTVFLDNYPELVTATTRSGQPVNRGGPTRLGPGQFIDLQFKDDVFGFGVYVKQGLFPSSVIIYLSDGTQRAASVSGYMPSIEFVGHVSTLPIKRVVIQPQANGSVEIQGFFIFSRRHHPRDLKRQ